VIETMETVEKLETKVETEKETEALTTPGEMIPQSAYEQGITKILIIGNSASNDVFMLLDRVFKAQGFGGKRYMLAYLYYSGCTFTQHVNFMNNNAPVYDYYKVSDITSKSKETEATMKYALEDEPWDVIFLHPGGTDDILHADFQREYSYGGIPFVDAHCNPDSDNLLIYGHNMLDGSMFRSLLKYEEKNYWEEHPVITFNTLYETREYEVLAAFYDRVYYKNETCFKFYKFIDAADKADYDYAISQFKEKAIYDTGVDAAYGDKLITLVTCAYHTSNGPFVVVARQK
jgi:sortase B